ncbi:MAG: hypothetical protein IH784_08745, partial [Bacteroidetes bacterium]|nr:hypothetical protein [Bacteroidota bacterium]
MNRLGLFAIKLAKNTMHRCEKCDVEFQKKAIGKMKDVAEGKGRTVLFVSHNMAAIENLCTYAMLLSHGAIDSIGETRVVIERYIKSIETVERSLSLKDRKDRTGSGVIRLTDFFLEDRSGNRVDVWQSGQ